MPIIELKGLTKEYRLGQLGSVKDTLLNALSRLSGKSQTTRETFKALDNVNLSVKKGEIIGIIGHNGAGKSTLLKHLAGITNPTSGAVEVRGSVAPLIEVGAGLHPELTGRENVYLNGSILGIAKETITRKLDDIVSFSELDGFFDTPVKRYSSGMRVRLGFAIATSFEADILIIDEVLAVGDLAFQRKCFSRLENMIKNKNMTVLLVSHNIRQVSRLCSRTILLENGKIIADGNPSDICNDFYTRSNKKVLNYAKEQRNTLNNVKSTDEFELLQIDILDENGAPTEAISTHSKLNISIEFSLKQDVQKPEIVVGTHTTDFLYLTNSSTCIYPERPSLSAGKHRIIFSIPGYPLAMGIYCVRLVFLDHHGRAMYSGETLKIFSVMPSATEANDELPQYRLINTTSEWKIDGAFLSNDPASST